MVASAVMAVAWNTLYDAVALGMYTYSRGAFRVRVVAPEDERIEEGTLYLAAHRAETDVPVICGSYYFAAQVWRQAAPRLHFAARDDLFEAGFFAGFPPRQPRLARRALYGVSIASHLERVCVHPITSATTMKLVQALTAVEPDTPIELALSDELADQLRARSEELGRSEAHTVGDIQRWDYVDLLWQDVEAADLPSELFRDAWARRAALATGDLRTVVDVIRSGEALLLFPEGRPSPDGALGPLQRGMGAILRRGRPERVRVFGLAYDPLTTGRASVVLSVGPSREPAARGREPDLLPSLAQAIALTTGQVVCSALVDSVAGGNGELTPAGLESSLEEAIAEAERTERVVDPELAERSARRRALESAVRAAEDRGLLVVRGPRSIELRAEAIADDSLVSRLVIESRSVRDEVASASAA